MPYTVGHSQMSEERDTERLDHLDRLFSFCPHAFFGYDAELEEQPWFIEIDGCEHIKHTAPTLRQLLDDSIKYEEGNNE